MIEPLLLSPDSGMGDHGVGSVRAFGDVLDIPLPFAHPTSRLALVRHPSAPGVTIFSKNLITGSSVFNPAVVACGELGKGRWRIAEGCGGGRGGIAPGGCWGQSESASAVN